jgi:hypothetical protein
MHLLQSKISAPYLRKGTNKCTQEPLCFPFCLPHIVVLNASFESVSSAVTFMWKLNLSPRGESWLQLLIVLSSSLWAVTPTCPGSWVHLLSAPFQALCILTSDYPAGTADCGKTGFYAAFLTVLNLPKTITMEFWTTNLFSSIYFNQRRVISPVNFPLLYFCSCFWWHSVSADSRQPQKENYKGNAHVNNAVPFTSIACLGRLTLSAGETRDSSSVDMGLNELIT